MNKSIITKDPVQDEKRDVSKDSKEVVRQDEKNIFEDRDGSTEEAGDVELVADLKALAALSLELEKTSDQEILGKGGVTKSEKLATQKKSLGGGRLNQDGSRPRSVLQELQDVISEESIPEESIESDHSQNEEERSERCAWEVKQFKKSFETLQLEIQSLEARIGKLEERKVAKAGKVEEEQEEKMGKMILPQPIVVKPFTVDDDSDFEEFTRDKQDQVWFGQEESHKTWQEMTKEGNTEDNMEGNMEGNTEDNKEGNKEGNKPWQEDWEDDFEVEELASVLLAVK